MILVIESIVACILFTALMLPSVYKNPINHIMSYPKVIRERVESLPQYKDTIVATERKHIAKKIAGVFLFAGILALIAWFSGAKTFASAFVHCFILFFVVNVYDVIILDILIFCNSKKVRIPGTEDMVKEYKSPWHHVIGGVKGIVIGAVVSVLAAGIIHLVSKI